MEQDLIKKAQAGDRQAFALLIAQNYDFIHAAAWKWTRCRADAEDVAQDVCLRIGASIRSFRGEGRFRTWLYTLTLNAVRDLARKSSRERGKTNAYRDDPSQWIDSEDEAEGAQEVWTAVQTLPRKQRDAVMLVYSEGLSHRDVAEILECSESTVGWHLHEARKRLRILLGREVA